MGYELFLDFEIIHITKMITNPTRKNAHHIPALNIVPTASQLVRAIISIMQEIASALFICFCFIPFEISTIVPQVCILRTHSF